MPMNGDVILKSMAAVVGLTACVVGIATLAAKASQPDVPKHAARQAVSAYVTIYHWREMNRDNGSYRVLGAVDVKAWPKDAWGAEVTLTPIPDCCGAHPTSVIFRRSEPFQHRLLGQLDTSRDYSLSFRYR